MKILVASDTHGDDLILQELLTEYPHMDGYFYCGDSELRASNPLFQQWQAVQGNMDYDPDFPLTLTAHVAGHTIFMAHGHKYAVGWRRDELVAAGQAVGADVILYGHTHVALAEVHQGILVVNPGSISQPRGELASLGGMYAVVTVDDDGRRVEYGTRTQGIIPS
ncbi:YfcE family phosphodiesterase [Lacticaseibacillus thailandensis]|uniref:YfcE family phosphodiesterase n=1 Tax=Lacticaseibacillus thailandensis TaxID=381741 RepID=UPI0006D0B74C|nr:metallophosphoesterase [Lacticaseibacillus thailandensis]